MYCGEALLYMDRLPKGERLCQEDGRDEIYLSMSRPLVLSDVASQLRETCLYDRLGVHCCVVESLAREEVQPVVRHSDCIAFRCPANDNKREKSCYKESMHDDAYDEENHRR